MCAFLLENRASPVLLCVTLFTFVIFQINATTPYLQYQWYLDSSCSSNQERSLISNSLVGCDHYSDFVGYYGFRCSADRTTAYTIRYVHENCTQPWYMEEFDFTCRQDIGGNYFNMFCADMNDTTPVAPPFPPYSNWTIAVHYMNSMSPWEEDPTLYTNTNCSVEGSYTLHTAWDTGVNSCHQWFIDQKIISQAYYCAADNSSGMATFNSLDCTGTMTSIDLTPVSKCVQGITTVCSTNNLPSLNSKLNSALNSSVPSIFVMLMCCIGGVVAMEIRWFVVLSKTG